MNIFRMMTTPVYLESSLEYLDTGIMEQQQLKYYQILESPESFDSSPPSGFGCYSHPITAYPKPVTYNQTLILLFELFDEGAGDIQIAKRHSSWG